MPDQQLVDFYIERLRELAKKHDVVMQRSADLDEQLTKIDGEGRGVAQALRAGAELEPDDPRIPPQFRGTAAAGRQMQPAADRAETKPLQTSGGPSRRSTPRRAGGRPPQVRHTEMVEWCRTILRENGQPMHVKAIAAALKQDRGSRGWRIPGAGETANVSVHLAQDPEVFTSPGPKGMWALTPGWNA